MGPLLAQTETARALASPALFPRDDVYEIFGKVATAILLGLLVGLEREWAKASDRSLFAGVRTFPFIALLGCVSAMIGTEHGNSWFFATAYLGFSLFVAANHFVVGGGFRAFGGPRPPARGHGHGHAEGAAHANGGAIPPARPEGESATLLWAAPEEDHGLDRRHEPLQPTGLGTTTEITSLLMFLFGGLVYWGHTGLAAALTVAVTVILSIKQPLHLVAQRVESQDIYATLKLAVVSIIILPLLPDRGLDVTRLERFHDFRPYFEALAVVNPRRVWLLVVFVSGVAFLGYVSAKVLGPGRGIALTGILGGIVNSTSVAVTMAERSHDDDRVAPQLALAVIVASTVMFIRTIVEVAFVNDLLAQDLVAPLAGATAFGLAASAYLWFRGARTPVDKLELKNPFSLVSALKFGALFTVMLVVTAYLVKRYERQGVYIAAMVGGFVNPRPINLSVASLASRDEISRHDAIAAVMLGSLANTILKSGWALVYGAPAFRRCLAPAAILLCLGGVAATGYVIVYGARLFN